jgi:glycosyltransferase involved in cell wall biosynthesis
MRFAIDALSISQPGGGRSATLNLLEPLLRLDQDNEYLVFVEQVEPSLAGWPQVRQMVAPTKQRFAVRLWAQATWPLLLRREQVDLLHHTKNLTTALCPCPAVVTVHDLTILVHPEIYPVVDVAYWRTVERYSLRHIERIIAVSRVTAADLQRFYGIAPERISVIYEGIDEAFAPVAAEQVAGVRAKYGLPADYILHVGSISPKKNLSTLARAYGRLVQSGAFDGPLVLVGRSYWPEGDSELDASVRAMGPDGRIIRTGPVPQEDLPALYAGCAAFAFPSLHEGFGLVPLEAMACGAPVVASRVGALPEVIGQVAVFVDEPTDAEALAERLGAVLGDSAWRAELARQGIALGRRFSRERAARETLALYRVLAGG